MYGRRRFHSRASRFRSRRYRGRRTGSYRSYQSVSGRGFTGRDVTLRRVPNLPQLFPRRLLVPMKLQYQFQDVLATGFDYGDNYIRLNSIYDPEFALGGPSVPGFAFLTGLYDSWLVHSTSIRASVTNGYDPTNPAAGFLPFAGRVGIIIPQDLATLPSDITDFTIMPNVHFGNWTVGGPNPNEYSTVRAYMPLASLGTFDSPSNRVYYISPQYWGGATTDPGINLFGIIFYQRNNAAALTAPTYFLSVQVELTFYVEFFDRLFAEVDQIPDLFSSLKKTQVPDSPHTEPPPVPLAAFPSRPLTRDQLPQIPSTVSDSKAKALIADISDKCKATRSRICRAAKLEKKFVTMADRSIQRYLHDLEKVDPDKTDLDTFYEDFEEESPLSPGHSDDDLSENDFVDDLIDEV